jgi:hypothetical protein
MAAAEILLLATAGERAMVLKALSPRTRLGLLLGRPGPRCVIASRSMSGDEGQGIVVLPSAGYRGQGRHRGFGSRRWVVGRGSRGVARSWVS